MQRFRRLARVFVPSYADSTLCLNPPLDVTHCRFLNTPRGHGALKPDADDIWEVLCVGLLFASGVATFVAWDCAATELDAEVTALVPWPWEELGVEVLLAWTVLSMVDVINVEVAAS